MSTDYYARIEQRRGPQPSASMLAAIARGLRLSLDERDHLFRLGGHPEPSRTSRDDHVDVGLMRILDRLTDTPAMVLSGAGETLLQTPLAVALFGDETTYDGWARAMVWRWFTDQSSREVYPVADHDLRGRQFAADLRMAYSRDGAGSRAGQLVEALLARSEEFAAVWAEHEVRAKHTQLKRIVHPEVGEMSLYCQTLVDAEQHQVLLVFTAEPGSPSDEKLRLLAVIGSQQVGLSPTPPS